MASWAWTCAQDIQVASSPCPSAPRTLMVEAKAHLDEGPCPPAGSRPYAKAVARLIRQLRSEEHTSELPSLMRNSHAVFCVQHKNTRISTTITDKQYTQDT